MTLIALTKTNTHKEKQKQGKRDDVKNVNTEKASTTMQLLIV